MQGRRKLSETEWMKKDRMMVRRSKGVKHQSAPVVVTGSHISLDQQLRQLTGRRERNVFLPSRVGEADKTHVLWELELCLALCHMWFLLSLICSTVLWPVVDRTLTVIL